MIFISYCEGLYGQCGSYALSKSCVVFGKYFLIVGDFIYILLGELLHAVMKQNILHLVQWAFPQVIAILCERN